MSSASKAVSMEEMDICLRVSGTSNLTASIQYSVDGVTFTQIGEVLALPVTTATANPFTLDLIAVAALQNVAIGAVVTIRIVPISSATTAVGGTFYVTDSSVGLKRGINIKGSVK